MWTGPVVASPHVFLMFALNLFNRFSKSFLKIFKTWLNVFVFYRILVMDSNWIFIEITYFYDKLAKQNMLSSAN